MATEYTIPITRRHYAGQVALEAGIIVNQEWAYDETNERIGIRLSDDTYRYIGQSELFPPGAGVVPTVQCSADNDFYSVAWTDYSDTTVVTGLTALTVKQIWYKQIGLLVFVYFSLAGTSNATSFKFTLPVECNTRRFRFPASVMDNGSDVAEGGSGVMNETNSTTVDLMINQDHTPDLASWTIGGNKRAEGQFWYEAASGGD